MPTRATQSILSYYFQVQHTHDRTNTSTYQTRMMLFPISIPSPGCCISFVLGIPVLPKTRVLCPRSLSYSNIFQLDPGKSVEELSLNSHAISSASLATANCCNVLGSTPGAFCGAIPITVFVFDWRVCTEPPVATSSE